MHCYYLSGPMSGLPEFNFPAFQSAVDDLRGRGMTVRSPHEKGSEGSGMSWESYLREDIGLMLECSALILLPGWPSSKGAKLELSIALGLNWPIYFYDAGTLRDMQLSVTPQGGREA